MTADRVYALLLQPMKGWMNGLIVDVEGLGGMGGCIDGRWMNGEMEG